MITKKTIYSIDSLETFTLKDIDIIMTYSLNIFSTLGNTPLSPIAKEIISKMIGALFNDKRAIINSPNTYYQYILIQNCGYRCCIAAKEEEGILVQFTVPGMNEYTDIMISCEELKNLGVIHD